MAKKSLFCIFFISFLTVAAQNNFRVESPDEDPVKIELGTWFSKSSVGYSNIDFYAAYRYRQHAVFAGLMYVNPDNPGLVFDYPAFIGGYRFYPKSTAKYAGFFFEYNLEFARIGRPQGTNACNGDPLAVESAERIAKIAANTICCGVKFTFLKWMYVDSGIGIGIRLEKNYTEYMHCNKSVSFYGDNKMRYYGEAIMAKLGTGFIF